MALRARDNDLSQGSENIGVTNKAVVMGTRAQATANATTRRRLADVSNANNAVGKQPADKQSNAISDDAENKPLVTLKVQELKPALGLKKSLATRNLLASSLNAASTTTTGTKAEAKNYSKEENVTAKAESYSGWEERSYSWAPIKRHRPIQRHTGRSRDTRTNP